MTFAKHIRAKHLLYSVSDLINVSGLTATQSQADIVSGVLIDRLNVLKETDRDFAEIEGKLYLECDPANPDTAGAFAELNGIRTDRRRMKREIVALQGFLNKLKKQSSANTSAAAVMSDYIDALNEH